MTVIGLTQSNIIRSKSSVSIKEERQLKRMRKFTSICLISLIILFFFFCALQTNLITSKAYTIKDLNEKVKTLSDLNKTLQINISKLNSISALELKSEDFGMISAQDIDYMVLSENTIVSAE